MASSLPPACTGWDLADAFVVGAIVDFEQVSALSLGGSSVGVWIFQVWKMSDMNEVNSPKIIQVEFNELCQPLLDKWMAAGDLPNFKALRDRSVVFRTDVDVDDEVFLEPWIQWFSMQTGRPFHEHKVFHLTDGLRSSVPDVWRILEAGGKSVASFGSMNVRPFRPKQGFFVPDPWSEHEDAWPAFLNSYNRFVSLMIREHTNPHAGSRIKQGLDFLGFMLRNGLSVSSVGRVVGQLLRERSGVAHSYQRVALMDDFQADVFEKEYKRTRPDFATFFSNSTAHLQHAYWKYMEPEKFGVEVSAKDVAVYSGAIRFGYMALDKILGRIAKLAEGAGARIIFATALSQQACPPEVIDGDKSYYRLIDVKEFLRRFRIDFKTIDATMTHQYLMTFQSAEQRELARVKIQGLQFPDGRKLFEINKWDEDNIYFACNFFDSSAASSYCNSDGVQFSFRDDFYKIPTTKNGRHHPSGSLWIQAHKAGVAAEEVSILDVLPTVADFLGVTMPPGVLPGRSLAGLLR